MVAFYHALWVHIDLANLMNSTLLEHAISKPTNKTMSLQLLQKLHFLLCTGAAVFQPVSFDTEPEASHGSRPECMAPVVSARKDAPELSCWFRGEMSPVVHHLQDNPHFSASMNRTAGIFVARELCIIAITTGVPAHQLANRHCISSIENS